MGQWGCGIRAHGVGIKIKERPISTPFAMPQFGEVFFLNEMTGYPTATQPVSLEHELRTADCGLRVRNCAFLVANATKNLVPATRIL